MSTILLVSHVACTCTVVEKSFAPIPPLPLGKYWKVFHFPLNIKRDSAWVVAAHRVVMFPFVAPPQTLQAPIPHSSIGDEF